MKKEVYWRGNNLVNTGMNFLKQVWASLYDRSFYREVKLGKTGDGVKYLAKLLAIVAIVISIIPVFGGLGLYLWNKDKVSGIENEIIAFFPTELELRLKNGELSTNVSEPYALAIPSSWNSISEEGKGDLPTNLIVIDTTRPINTADFKAYDTVMIISKNEVGFLSQNDRKIQIQRIDNFDANFTLTHDSFAGLVHRGFEILSIVGKVLLVLLPFIIFAVLFFGQLLYLFFGALIVWSAATLRHIPLTYGEAYRYSLYLVTLPILLSYPLATLFKIPFVFTVVLFAIAYYILKPDVAPETPKNLETEPVSQPETPKDPETAPNAPLA